MSAETCTACVWRLEATCVAIIAAGAGTIFFAESPLVLAAVAILEECGVAISAEAAAGFINSVMGKTNPNAMAVALCTMAGACP